MPTTTRKARTSNKPKSVPLFKVLRELNGFVLGVAILDVGQVLPAAERPAGAGENQTTYGFFFLGGTQGLFKSQQHIVVESVQHVRPV